MSAPVCMKTEKVVCSRSVEEKVKRVNCLFFTVPCDIEGHEVLLEILCRYVDTVMH